jgi:hypothetical protein
MTTRLILYYSKQCKHSRDILSIFTNNSDFLNMFDLIDIAHNTPPEYIKAVPALLIPKNNGEADMLVGKSVFDWINNLLKQKNDSGESNNNNNDPNNNSGAPPAMQDNPNTGISDFDPCTMNGFSDNFSFLGDGNENEKSKPIDHNFSFLNSDNNNLINPTEFKESSGKNNVKSDMERAYESFKNNRDTDIPQQIRRA